MCNCNLLITLAFFLVQYGDCSISIKQGKQGWKHGSFTLSKTLYQLSHQTSLAASRVRISSFNRWWGWRAFFSLFTSFLLHLFFTGYIFFNASLFYRLLVYFCIFFASFLTGRNFGQVPRRTQIELDGPSQTWPDPPDGLELISFAVLSNI